MAEPDPAWTVAGAYGTAYGHEGGSGTANAYGSTYASGTATGHESVQVAGGGVDFAGGAEPDAAGADDRTDRPGSDGEHGLQRRLQTTERADRFYDDQVLDHLNERMREFVQRQEMLFLATADRNGECDSSFRAGPPGFLRVLDERTLIYPEYRGNGVHASLGNILENPHLGIMLVDFARARIGLHINGRARIVEDEDVRARYPDLPEDTVPGRRAQVWVWVEVEEAYIHCAKHIPQMQKVPKGAGRDWGTDDYKRKGGDFFGVARDSRDSREERRRRATQPATQPAAEQSSAQPQPQPQSQPQPHAYVQPQQQEYAHPQQHRPEQQHSTSGGYFAQMAARAADGHHEQPGNGYVPRHARAPQPAEPAAGTAGIAGGAGPVDWRQQAEQALAEARRRGANQANANGGSSEPGSYHGWFG